MESYRKYSEQKEALRGVLKILLDTEQIDHEVATGVARKIIADGNIEGLSAKQRNVFDEYIKKPFIDVSCDNEGCGHAIDICSLAEAYKNRDEFSGLYSVDCTIYMNRCKYYCRRDLDDLKRSK
jgi:hypothetical protein